MDRYEADEGPEEVARLLAGWRSRGWPGVLTAENERVLWWARVAEVLTPEAADARVGFEVDEGNEQLLVGRQVAAVGYLRQRAVTETRKRLEAQRGA